jgi:hypothetical protein
MPLVARTGVLSAVAGGRTRARTSHTRCRSSRMSLRSHARP